MSSSQHHLLILKCLFSMKKNKSDGDAEKKQKGKCNLGLSSSASFFENDSIHGDEGGVDKLDRNSILGKIVVKCIFEIGLTKMKQKTRFIRRRQWSKKEIGFYMLVVHPFHDLPSKNEQLIPLLVAIVKRCTKSTFQNKFQMKKMYTESQDIRTKYIN